MPAAPPSPLMMAGNSVGPHRFSTGTCAGPDGCRHDPVGVDAVRSAIDRVLAADVCPGESLPPVVPALGQRARTLIDRAAGETNPARSARLVRTAIQRLKRSARRVVEEPEHVGHAADTPGHPGRSPPGDQLPLGQQLHQAMEYGS